MKNITIGIAVLAMLIGVAGYAVAEANPELDRVALKSMTVAELEKAGDASRAEKDYPQAIRYFQAALKKDSNNAAIYNKMGVAELQLSNSKAARYDFQHAIRINAKFAPALNNIGAVDLNDKKPGSAVKYFKKAIALEETNATYHLNLGTAWLGQNKLDRAITEYTRALELDPEVINRHSRTGTSVRTPNPEERARFDYLLAKVYASRGELDQCLQCLKRAKEGGYRDLANVYKDEQFARLWQDQRLVELVAPPAK